MNRSHKIFVIQIILSTLIMFSLMYIINTVFKNLPDSEDYLVANNEITSLRKSSSEILDNLISKDELTFDPSNGVSIKKVFDNLKVESKKNILLLGSSQLITVSGDKSFDNYLRRVDKILEKLYKDKFIIYNISLGGMTVTEKEIILNKMQELYDFDAIIMSIGPYDCRENKVRKTIQDLNKIVFEPKIFSGKLQKKEIQNIGETKFSLSISRLNTKIEKNTNEILENNFSFYKNKTVIKSWLSNSIDSFFIEKENIKGSEEPNGWETFNQTLTTKTGWVYKSLEPRTRALKIINTGKNASWKGIKVNLKTPTKTIIFGGFSKSENAQGSKLYCLDFKVEFTDGSHVWYYKGLSFKQGTNDWSQVEKKVTFKKKVASITPTLLFYKGTGTVWFDDVYAKPVNNGSQKENILINSTIEEEKVMKDVHTLKFEEKVWNTIFENSQKMITFFKQNTKPSTKKYLLIPPVYNSIQKNGYEQSFYSEKYAVNLKEFCSEFEIGFLDASKLLNEAHFIEYQSGKRKGMIEPLHFNEKGHRKLAKYLYKKLKDN